MFQVKVSSANPIFFVGVTQRPFDCFGEQPRNVWVLEARTGRVYEDGKYGPFAFKLGDGDLVTVTCNTTMKTLAFKHKVSTCHSHFSQIVRKWLHLSFVYLSCYCEVTFFFFLPCNMIPPRRKRCA